VPNPNAVRDHLKNPAPERGDAEVAPNGVEHLPATTVNSHLEIQILRPKRVMTESIQQLNWSLCIEVISDPYKPQLDLSCPGVTGLADEHSPSSAAYTNCCLTFSCYPTTMFSNLHLHILLTPKGNTFHFSVEKLSVAENPSSLSGSF